MYPHHKESLGIMKNYFLQTEGLVAIIFGGSVAKGNERPDSDLDGMIVVEPQIYEKKVKQNMTAECVQDQCTYEGGYFDVKYMTKEYLLEAAKKGSEPTRNSFYKAQVLYSKDAEIEEIVKQIARFQTEEKEDKMLSFHSNLCLNHGYFLQSCKVEGYMLLHACGEIIYSVYRMILQENEVLFPCNRRLEETVEKLENKPKQIMELARAFEKSLSVEDANRFVDAFREWSSYQPPEDFGQVLSRYCADFEQWWRVPRPLVAEW